MYWLNSAFLFIFYLWIRISDPRTQMNADPTGSGFTSLPMTLNYVFRACSTLSSSRRVPLSQRTFHSSQVHTKQSKQKYSIRLNSRMRDIRSWKRGKRLGKLSGINFLNNGLHKCMKFTSRRYKNYTNIYITQYT